MLCTGWLLMVGRQAEAEESLQRMAAQRLDSTQLAQQLAEMSASLVHANQLQHRAHSLAKLAS